jgi:hypothetical protein
MATANRAGLLDADPVFQYLPDTPGHPDVIDEDAVSDAHAGEPVWLIGTDSLDVAIPTMLLPWRVADKLHTPSPPNSVS